MPAPGAAMLLPMRAQLVPLLCFCATACTTTQALNVRDMQAVSAGGHRDALVLRATDGSTVRIDPNTSIRFTTTMGTATEWVSARELEVGEAGVIIHRDAEPLSIGWDDINNIDARNVSGSKSLALLLGSAAVVAAIVAIAATTKHAPRWTEPAAITGARVAVGVAYVANHDRRRDAGRSSSASMADENSAPEPETHHLFEGPVRRRSTVEIVPALAGYARLGADLPATDPLRYGATLSAVARINEMIELGFGVERTNALMRIGEHAAVRDGQLLGFMRGGFSFYLDDEHRIAVPIYADLGFGSNVAVEMRVAAGLRVRMYDTLTLGLYPVVLTYTNFRDIYAYGDPRWTLPSALETSFAF